MIKIINFLAGFFLLLSASNTTKVTNYLNNAVKLGIPLMGSKSAYNLCNGFTCPAITRYRGKNFRVLEKNLFGMKTEPKKLLWNSTVSFPSFVTRNID